MTRDTNPHEDWPDAYNPHQDPQPRRLHSTHTGNFGPEQPDTPRWFKVWTTVFVIILLGMVGVGIWAVVEVVQWVTKK
jgi:hypothetical protein